MLWRVLHTLLVALHNSQLDLPYFSDEAKHLSSSSKGVVWVVPRSQEWLKGTGGLNSLKRRAPLGAMGIPMTRQAGAIATWTVRLVQLAWETHDWLGSFTILS